MKKLALSYLAFFFVMACSGDVRHERFPGGQGRTTDQQRAEGTRAVLGGLDSMNNPLAQGDSRVARSGGPARVAGVVDLARGAEVKDGMSFFISARPLAGGPPIAVRRLGRVSFPHHFELTEDDRMMQGTAFEGPILLSLRLDQDGDPLTRQEGDLGVSVETEVGVTDLQLVLDYE